MTSALSAAEAALFTALNGNVGADVFQDVPEDAPLPVVIIGDLDGSRLGSKGDEDWSLAVVILSLTVGEERRPLLDIMAAIETQLEGATLTSQAGWRISPTLESASATLSETGDGYVGRQSFTIFALRD